MDSNHEIEKTVDRQRTLMAVLAHPDDETFGMGGTLALYARRGVAVHLVCATRGEVGMVDEEHMQGFQSVGEARENELRCAAGMLGLTGVHFLGYRDSGMTGTPDNTHPQALAAAPLEEVAAKVAHLIRQHRPQVVITFDPIGGYRHPDHIAIHQATVKAFQYTSDPAFPDDLPPHQPERLYFHTISRRMLRWVVKIMPLIGRDPRKWGRNEDIDLTALAVEDFPVHAVIDYQPVVELKQKASACHASQGGATMSRSLIGWALRRGSAKELFMQAYPAPSSSRRVEDLFEGVTVTP